MALKKILTLEDNKDNRRPGLKISLIPFVFLFGMIGLLVNAGGAGYVQDWSWGVLLLCAVVALSISLMFYRRPGNEYKQGLKFCSVQIMPALPILALIATVSVSWMASGVVPTLIVYGLELINPSIFPLVACLVCACVSVLSGSSWTTIATIGVAFIGIGEAMGYYPPLGGVGLFATPAAAEENAQILISGLEGMYNISAWTLLIPLLTIVLLALKVSTRNTLILSTLAGCLGVILFQGGLSDNAGRPDRRRRF